MDKEISQVLC